MVKTVTFSKRRILGRICVATGWCSATGIHMETGGDRGCALIATDLAVRGNVRPQCLYAKEYSSARIARANKGVTAIRGSDSACYRLPRSGRWHVSGYL